jgi:hypothetical protein
MNEISNGNLLRSWKEIAAYLGCDVRTSCRWEARYGMPVHRAEGGGSRSSVFAYKDELDRWFRDTFRNGHPDPKEAGGGRPWVKWALGGAAVLVLAGAVFLAMRLLAKGQPADFAIEGSYFIALDRHKHELWRYDTKVEELLPESYFRQHFQVLSRNDDGDLPCLVISDIDGDGDVEVLITPKGRSDTTGLGWLVCLDRTGKERWRFEAGRELTCGSKVYSPDYRISGFVCHDLDDDRRLETLVIAFQKPDWPCQMVVLDASGRTVGEYWNAGYLRYPLFHDLDGDGREELIVCGVNNEYKGGCLMVFDPGRISGASPQSGKFACREFASGSELYYVTVPYTDVSAAMGIVVDGFNYEFITKNDRIQLTYGQSLFYEFDFRLACAQVFWGHGYEYWHEEQTKAGRVTSVLGDGYAKMLRDGVRYWDGTGWTAEPTMVRH